MGTSIVDNILGYSTETRRKLFIGMKTAVLLPQNAIYKPEFKKTAIQEIKSTGGAGNYTGAYKNGVGGSYEAKWVEYEAGIDRYMPFDVDALTEMASYLSGQKPTIIKLFENWCENNNAEEVDSVTMARLTTEAITGGATPVTLQTNSITFADLVKYEAKLYNQGVDMTKPVFVFMRADLYADLQNQIIEKFGLANPNIISKYGVKIPGFREEDEAVEISTEVIKYNSFVIIRMPESRMYDKVVLLDGESEGQENGGTTPADDAKALAMLFVPEGTAFLQARYAIANFLVPSYAFDVATDSFKVDELMNKFMSPDTQFVLENIGVNQLANSFHIDSRIVYEPHAVKVNASNILPVYAAEEGGSTSTSTSTSTN